MTEEGGRPPAAFEERGRPPAASGGLRTAPTIADGWLRRPGAGPTSNPLPRRGTVTGSGSSRGAIVNYLVTNDCKRSPSPPCPHMMVGPAL